MQLQCVLQQTTFGNIQLVVSIFNTSYRYFMDQIQLHTNTCTKLHVFNSIQSEQKLEQNQLMQLCAPFHNQA
jgi:hypothetical protein